MLRDIYHKYPLWNGWLSASCLGIDLHGVRCLKRRRARHELLGWQQTKGNWGLMREDEFLTTSYNCHVFQVFLNCSAELSGLKLAESSENTSPKTWSKHCPNKNPWPVPSKLRRRAPPASTTPRRGCGLWRQSPLVRSSRACHKWCRSCQWRTWRGPCPSPSRRGHGGWRWWESLCSRGVNMMSLLIGDGRVGDYSHPHQDTFSNWKQLPLNAWFTIGNCGNCHLCQGTSSCGA